MRSLILTAAALLATVSVARTDPTLVRRWNAPPVIVDQVQLDNGNQFCGLRIGAPTTSA